MSVAENEGTVQVCATLSLGTEVDITVTLATSDGTGMDVHHQIGCVHISHHMQLRVALTMWVCPWTWCSLLAVAVVPCSV